VAQLTVAALREKILAGDRWLSDGGGRGSGRLWARLLPGRVFLYFRYRHNGKSCRLSLGPYDESGKAGLTLPQARDRANELGRVYRSGITDIHGYVDRDEATKRTNLETSQRAALREQQLAQSGSLQRLLDAYLAYLGRLGKVSVRDARSVFKHVPASLLERRASELAMTDFVPVIGALVEAGKGRTASRLRSYLRAPYELALASQSDPAAPEEFRAFEISYNPVATVSTRGLRQFNRRRTRALDAHELGSYLSRLEALPDGYVRDALLLQLYLGGQRIRQLLRLEHPEIDIPACTVTLYDTKGRRTEPRVHIVPLVPQALAIAERLVSVARRMGKPGVWGRLYATTLTHAVGRIRDAMLAAGEAREPFQLRDVRRSCETLMASMGISETVRGHVQSHGLGGVQNRHYDMHKYLKEKRLALLKLSKLLEKLKAEARGKAKSQN
jgi:integrase